MDKKSIGVVSVIGVILLGIIIAIFVYDNAINTTIADVNGTKYDKSDFESYLKVWQYENGDTPVDVAELFEEYKGYKLYAQYADLYDLELPSGEKVTALTDTEKEKIQTDYNLTENEYMRVKTEMAEVMYLINNLPNYFIISDEEYDELAELNKDSFVTYDYRVMQVPVKEEEKPSGDVSGDAANVKTEAERKTEAKSKAVEALAKVKSGDKFEDVAKDYGTGRFVYTPTGYSYINGTLESVSKLYMEKYLGAEAFIQADPNIMKSLKELNKGEYSEIYEADSYYMFVYLENIRDGLDEDEKKVFKTEVAQNHIVSEAKVTGNNIVLKSIDLEKLIPALTKVKTSGDEVKEDNDTSTNTNTTSGEVKETVSGEIKLSGDAQ